MTGSALSRTLLASAAIVSLGAFSQVQAASVTPDVIFGSGNANGGFTVETSTGVELGLRGKLRYDTNGQPQNTFNYDGVRTYTFSTSEANPPAGRSAFNFEWSINAGSQNLDALTYLLEIDFDPTTGTDFTSFDPINLSFADHAIGNDTTGNGGGTVAADAAAYASLIGSNNVAQNSWNLGFFEPAGFDPATEGLYTIGLTAFSQGVSVASTSIDIQFGEVPAAVPLPAAGLLLLGALGGLGAVGRRRKAAV